MATQKANSVGTPRDRVARATVLAVEHEVRHALEGAGRRAELSGSSGRRAYQEGRAAAFREVLEMLPWRDEG